VPLESAELDKSNWQPGKHMPNHPKINRSAFDKTAPAPVTTPDEARQMLALKGGDKVGF
jgi:hypothetical protein